jgi:hypothetical protein
MISGPRGWNWIESGNAKLVEEQRGKLVAMAVEPRCLPPHSGRQNANHVAGWGHSLAP